MGNNFIARRKWYVIIIGSFWIIFFTEFFLYQYLGDFSYNIAITLIITYSFTMYFYYKWKYPYKKTKLKKRICPVCRIELDLDQLKCPNCGKNI